MSQLQGMPGASRGRTVASCHPPVEFLSVLLVSSPFAKPGERGSRVFFVHYLEEWLNANRSRKQKRKHNDLTPENNLKETMQQTSPRESQ